MINKVKLNAAIVIKHMTEKELKKYKITLEKEGKSSSVSAPTWFKEWFKVFYAEFKSFEKDMLDKWSKQEQFNSFVLEQFKKHGWTK